MNITYCHDIAYSYRIHKSKENSTVIILLDGLPSNPETKQRLIEKLFESGFDIIFPFYQGTYGSKGLFLQTNPVNFFTPLLKPLKIKGITIDQKIYKPKKICILASSFGGGIGLVLSRCKFIDKVCLLSPVLSFKTVKGIETLRDYLLETFPNVYRHRSEDWHKLIEDRYYCPFKLKKLDNKKILLFAGIKDDQLSIEEIKNFSSHHQIKLIRILTTHISLSKITDQIFSKIIHFFYDTDF